MYTRNTQKLLYWLIADYANYLEGNNPSSKPSEHFNFKAKKELKKLYLKTINYKPSKTPIEDFENTVKGNIEGSAYEDVMFAFVKCIQDLFIKQEDFSLCLNLMSQKKANKFTNFLFDFMLDNEIPFRQEIQELYSNQEQERYVYKMLSKKKCVVCGEYADLHHSPNLGVPYEQDDGYQTGFLPLCRKHHSEAHNIGPIDFESKYHFKAYWLKNDDEVKFFKKIYKNHFKGWKEKE